MILCSYTSGVCIYIHTGQEATAWGRDLNPTPRSFETIFSLYNRGKEDYYYLFTVISMRISVILAVITPLLFWLPLICFIPAYYNAKEVYI